MEILEDRLKTQMVIPVSKGTYFNTNWTPKEAPLCAYDMLYHPPDYNPKSARSDRQEPKIIRKNIWLQEFHKGIASTTHFQLGRPKWKPIDLPTKEYVRAQVKNENPHMRIYNVLEWAVLLNEGKPLLAHAPGSKPLKPESGRVLLSFSFKSAKKRTKERNFINEVIAAERRNTKMILSAQDCQCPLVDEGVTLVNSPICSGTLYFMVLLEAFLKGRCNIATPCSRIESQQKLRPEYDFIVVGAGSAGSIVAGRLSENENFKVLLLEAGGQEPIGARPPSFYRTFWSNEKLDWNYRTVPADYCLDQDGKGCLWPRGKVLGGSSVLNGMMYHRGHAADYEDWVHAGAEGWSWEENLPYFDMTEGNKQIGTLVDGKYHSASGPLPVQQFRYQPLAAHVLLRAINETGLPIIADMNDPSTPHGFSIAQTFNEDGQRFTTARAYLKPHSERPNLDVKLNAHVSKVLFLGNQATGVEFIDDNGKTQTVQATKEVILSAGALNSPHILMLSGIGPRNILEPLNIPVIADLPVGQTLKNHYGITLNFYLTKLNNTEELDWSVLTKYLLTRDGPMAGTGVTQLTGLLYSSLADQQRLQPDIQFFFNGFYAECSRNGVINEFASRSSEGKNVSANAAILLPRSTGFMTINSTNPLTPPLFYPGYFTHPDDLIIIRDGARYLQQIFETDTLKNKYGIELDNKTTERCSRLTEWSDAWIECMARVNTDPQNHQVATAAIGLVIDPQLKVYNVEGLRVIDASSVPTLLTGNPQAAIMMVAERGVDFIRKQWG